MLSTQAVEYDFPFGFPWCHHGKIACGNRNAVWLALKPGVHLKIIDLTHDLTKLQPKNVRILLLGFPSLLQRHFGVTWRRSSGRSYADDASGAHLVGVCGSQNSQWAVVISVHHTRGWCLGSHSQGGILLTHEERCATETVVSLFEELFSWSKYICIYRYIIFY